MWQDLHAPREMQHLPTKLAREMEGWNPESLNKERKVKTSMFPTFKRDAWLRLFLKYNTSIPSSAAVERLFSTGSDILRKSGLA